MRSGSTSDASDTEVPLSDALSAWTSCLRANHQTAGRLPATNRLRPCRIRHHRQARPLRIRAAPFREESCSTFDRLCSTGSVTLRWTPSKAIHAGTRNSCGLRFARSSVNDRTVPLVRIPIAPPACSRPGILRVNSRAIKPSNSSDFSFELRTPALPNLRRKSSKVSGSFREYSRFGRLSARRVRSRLPPEGNGAGTAAYEIARIFGNPISHSRLD